MPNICLQVVCKKKAPTRKIPCKCLIFKWAQLGMIQRPPDYELFVQILLESVVQTLRSTIKNLDATKYSEIIKFV